MSAKYYIERWRGPGWYAPGWFGEDTRYIFLGIRDPFQEREASKQATKWWLGPPTWFKTPNDLPIRSDVWSENTRIDDAIRTYLLRKAGVVEVPGYYDEVGNWYPASEERMPCCQSVLEPLNDPNDYDRHCCSMVHVAQLYAIDIDVMMERYKALEEMNALPVPCPNGDVDDDNM